MRKDVIIGMVFGIIIIIAVFAIILLPDQIHTTPATKAENTEQSATVTSVQPTPLPGMRSGAVLGKLSHDLILNSSVARIDEKTMARPTIMVYKTVPPDVSHEAIYSLAKKFGVAGKLREGDAAISIQSEDLKRSVEIDNKSGYAAYSDSNQLDETNSVFIPASLPSDEKAIKIATKFLKDRDLLPEGAIPVEVEHIKTYKLDEDNSKKVVWEKLAVWFGGNLNDLKVHGRSIRLVINANGDIIEYDANWREYQPFKEYPVKSSNDAFGELKTRGVAVGMNTPDIVSIDQIELAYNSLPGAYKEDYLEPVYYFKGQAMMNGKSISPVLEKVPALTYESVKSLSS